MLCPPTGKTLKLGNLGVQEVASHTDTSSNPLGDLMLSFSATLDSVDFEVLALKTGTLPQSKSQQWYQT